MHPRIWLPAAVAVTFMVAPAPAEQVLFDQIGPAPFAATSLTSSQFPIGDPSSAFTTLDNISLAASEGGGGLLHITQIDATVARLSDFGSLAFAQSWTIEIYSSLEASFMNLTGDVASVQFEAPTTLTTGWSSFFGDPVELATFDVDIVVAPGDYYMTVAAENDGSENGTLGIAHSSIGDGSSWFSGPGAGAAIPVANPAGYRVFGDVVPAPGALAVLSLGLLGRRRRDAGP